MAGIEKVKSEVVNDTMRTKADVALTMAQAQKTAMEVQMGPQAQGKPQNPADMLNAQADLMNAENDRMDLTMKQKQIEVDDKDISIDGENRAAERDSREKLAMVNLQRDALQMDHEKAMLEGDMAKIAMQQVLKPEPSPAPKGPGKKPKPGLVG